MPQNVGKILVLVIALALVVALIVAAKQILGRNGHTYYNEDGSYRHITETDSFKYVENHPAYAAFSAFIQPWKDTVNQIVTPLQSIRFVCGLNHTNTASILDGFNFVMDASAEGQIYYDYYTEDERAADPTKEDTGLIFIPGEKDAPVAFLTSGGAFKSVCLFGEAFPVGNILHQAGYNVFILKYRVNPDIGTFEETMAYQEKYANEDFGKALQFIFENQETFGVNMEGYSVWGFSAGGRTTFLWGLDNDYGYEHYGLPAPVAMVLVYSGWYDKQFEGQYGTVPPTYFAWLPNDDVLGEKLAGEIQQYIDLLKDQGTPMQEHPYYEAKHGFGEGRGTDAEGWIAEAAKFWETQRAAVG